MKRFTLSAALVLLQFAQAVTAADTKVLRVGIAPTSPPIQFWDNNKMAGLEVDFANKLGEELGREIELVDLKFAKLIPALLNKEIDIIMAGMSVTRVRSMQVAFAAPYLQIGQMPLVRLEDQKQFTLPLDVLMTDKEVGATEHTTSEYLLMQEFPKAKKTLFSNQAAAANALKKKKIDLLILDSPYIFWLAMKNEGKLTPVPLYFTEENLAWAMRKEDMALHDAVSIALAKWKKTGVLDAMIKKWIPDFQ